MASTLFQSAPPVKGATVEEATAALIWMFQSAPPVKGATSGRMVPFATRRFQSAPPVKGATATPRSSAEVLQVSIRAPREGGDGGWGERSQGHGRFNPRPP